MPFFTLLLVVVLGGQLIAGIIVRNGIETNLRLNTIHTFLPLSLLNSHLNGTLILAQTILEWRYMEIIRLTTDSWWVNVRLYRSLLGRSENVLLTRYWTESRFIIDVFFWLILILGCSTYLPSNHENNGSVRTYEAYAVLCLRYKYGHKE